MTTKTLTPQADTFDDRIKEVLPMSQEGNMDLRILDLTVSKFQTTMDCDDHPSCDCYSQCHLIFK